MNILSSLLNFIGSKISDFTSRITDIEGKLTEAVIVKSYTYSYQNLAAGGALSITGTNFGASTPSGYLPFAVRRATTGSNWCYITAIRVDGGTGTMLSIHNVGASAISGAATIRVAYIRSSLIRVIAD